MVGSEETKDGGQQTEPEAEDQEGEDGFGEGVQGVGGIMAIREVLAIGMLIERIC